MHYDEYIISLRREMSVCKSSIREIESSLARIDDKHNSRTTALMERSRTGELAADSDWAEKHQALETWKTRLRQYEALFSFLNM